MKSISIKLNDEDFEKLESQRDVFGFSRVTYIKYLLNIIWENGGWPKLKLKTLSLEDNNVVETLIDIPIRKKNKRKYPRMKKGEVRCGV